MSCSNGVGPGCFLLGGVFGVAARVSVGMPPVLSCFRGETISTALPD